MAHPSNPNLQKPKHDDPWWKRYEIPEGLPYRCPDCVHTGEAECEHRDLAEKARASDGSAHERPR